MKFIASKTAGGAHAVRLQVYLTEAEARMFPLHTIQVMDYGELVIKEHLITGHSCTRQTKEPKEPPK